ncbi:MAG: SdiA-regulated domain-containing protein, partial [Pseudomonadaceae bacterium]
EGVTYLGDDLLVMAEERSQTLVIVPLPTADGPLRRADYQAISLGLHAADNSGFEGVGYDRAGDRLFVVKQHSPRKLYEIQGLKRSLRGTMALKVIDREAWIEDKDMASDLASVHFDERTGHLVLLSDEAKMMLELDGKGRMVSFRSLWSGFAGLERSVPQAEGMTFDARGNLYLVSEPNLFYAFDRD